MFEEYFRLFRFNIVWPTFSLKEEYISCDDQYNTESYLSEIIEYDFIVVDEKHPDSIDTDCPKDRADHIIHPKFILSHTTCSSDKWHKSTCKIMKFSEDDVPKSIFLYLFMEYISLCLSDTKPIAIFLYQFCPVPFTDPVSKIIPEHSADYCRGDRPDDMSFPPESPYENHDIHPRDSRPDDRKWLDTGRKECDEIIPISKCCYEIPDPLYTNFDPFWSYERDADKYKRQYGEKNREKFRKGLYDIFEYVFHISRIWKMRIFAKSKSQYIPINLLTSMI